MTWAAAREKFPKGQVLSLETGHKRNYDSEAYASYKNSPRNSFPVNFNREELARKAWVVGIEIDGNAKAYPIELLTVAKQFDDLVGKINIQVTSDDQQQYAVVIDRETKEPIPSVRSYWFAWQAFYPETEVWGGDQHKNDSRGQ